MLGQPGRTALVLGVVMAVVVVATPVLVAHDGRQQSQAETDRLPGQVSPDGQWVVIESGRGATHAVYVARADGGVRRRVAGGVASALASWSPDSSRVALLVRSSASDSDAIWIVDVANGGNDRLESGEPPTTAIAWFPDNRRFCYGADNTVVVVDAVAKTVSRLTLPREIHADAVAWAPGGNEVAVRSSADGRWHVQVIRR